MTTRTRGFTLIELLVVVGIVGILAAIGIVSYNGYVNSSKKKSAENIKNSFLQFLLDAFYPFHN